MHLRAIGWDHPRCRAPMLAASEQYVSQHPGITVSWSFRPLAAFNDQPLEELAQAGDLLVVDHPFAGTAAAGGSVVPLDTHDDGRLAAIREHAIGSTFVSYASGDHVWALPVDAACQVAAWRPDLLSEPPDTWDEVVALARQRPGGVALPLYPTDTICSLISLSGGSSVTLEAVEQLAELLPFVHPESFAMNPPAMLDAMAEGEQIAYVPLVFGYSGYTGYDGPHSLAFGSAPTGAPTILGGAGIAVSADSRARDAAIDLALWLSGKDGQHLAAAAGGQPSDRRAWQDATRGPFGSFFTATREAIEHAFVRETTVGWPRFQEQAGIVATAMLRRGSSAAEIVTELDRLASTLLP